MVTGQVAGIKTMLMQIEKEIKRLQKDIQARGTVCFPKFVLCELLFILPPPPLHFDSKPWVLNPKYDTLADNVVGFSIYQPVSQR